MIVREFDFVKKYVRCLCAISDAPSPFQEAGALFLLSAAVGRKWVFQSIPETTIFGEENGITGKLLSLWFIIIGKSRITRKTSGVMKHVIEISKKVFGERRLLTEAFTPESLIEQMSKMSVRSVAGRLETVCCWICDEIAWFFQQLRKRKSYMASADAFLSKMYDGATYSRATIQRGKETVWNPYLTCFLASTDYLPTLFDELGIRLGFMNRFIYVVAERKKRKPLRTEPLTEEEEKQVEEIMAFLKALAERTSTTNLEMTDEAKEIYDSFEEKIEEQIENEDLGIKEGYCGQLPNFVVRISCLYRISRMTPEEIRNYSDRVLTVEKQDVERAIVYVQKAWGWFEKVIEIMQSNGKVKPRDLAKSAVCDYLKEGKERSSNEIKAYVNRHEVDVSQATFYNALAELKREGKIVQTRHGFYKRRLQTSEVQESAED